VTAQAVAPRSRPGPSLAMPTAVRACEVTPQPARAAQVAPLALLRRAVRMLEE